MFNILLLVIFIWVILLIASTDRAKNQGEYITAGKKTKIFSLIATLVMTEVNPMSLIAMAALGYEAGYRALWMAVIAFVAPLVASIMTAKKWKNFDSSCISQLFDSHLGFKVGNIVRIILLIPLIILSAVYLKGVIIFSSSIFPQLPFYIPITIILFFCLFSVITKGLGGIIRMDIIGFWFTSLFLILCLIFSYGKEASITPLDFINGETILSWQYLSALLFLQLIMYSLAPWWGQKIFSAKSVKIAYQASLLTPIVLFCFYICVILSAVQLRKWGVLVKNPDFAFPQIVITFFPSYLKLFCVITFFYVATTTICGVWSSMVGLITSGILQKNDSDSPELNYILWFLLAIITSYLAINKVENLLHAAVLAVMQIGSIYFSVIAIFYFKRISKWGCLTSIFSSNLTGYLLFLFIGEKGNYIWYWVIWGLPIMFTLGYWLSLMFPDHKEATCDAQWRWQ